MLHKVATFISGVMATPIYSSSKFKTDSIWLILRSFHFLSAKNSHILLCNFIPYGSLVGVISVFLFNLKWAIHLFSCFYVSTISCIHLLLILTELHISAGSFLLKFVCPWASDHQCKGCWEVGELYWECRYNLWMATSLCLWLFPYHVLYCCCYLCFMSRWHKVIFPW